MSNVEINPIAFRDFAGDVLPLPGGRVIWRIDPMPEEAPDADIVQFNRYVAALRYMNHHVVVGGMLALSRAMLDLLAAEE